MTTGDERKHQPCPLSSPFPDILNFSFAVRLPVDNRYGTAGVLTGRLAGLVNSSSSTEIVRFTCRIARSFSSSISESLFASGMWSARRGSLTIKCMAMHRNSVGPRVRMGARSRKFHLAYRALSFRLVAAKNQGLLLIA